MAWYMEFGILTGSPWGKGAVAGYVTAFWIPLRNLSLKRFWGFLRPQVCASSSLYKRTPRFVLPPLDLAHRNFMALTYCSPP